jgi:hypothetical protein
MADEFINNESDNKDEFPVPDGWSLAEDDVRPGEPLRPGENTIVDRGNNPLQDGETIAVWVKHYADAHGTAICRTDLQVIGDDGEGDIFAIFDAQSPLGASQVFRIASDLSTISIGRVYGVPSYDDDEGVLTVTREVKTHGKTDLTLIEARSLGGAQDWAVMPGGEL